MKWGCLQKHPFNLHNCIIKHFKCLVHETNVPLTDLELSSEVTIANVQVHTSWERA